MSPKSWSPVLGFLCIWSSVWLLNCSILAAAAQVPILPLRALSSARPHTHHIHTHAPCSTCTRTISPPSLVHKGRVRTIYSLFPALCKLGGLGNEQPSPPGSSVSSSPVPVSVSPFLFPAPCLWNIVWSWLWFHHSPWSPPWLTLCLSHL